MTSQNYVLGIVGSPNPEGRTNELVTAALIGAKQAGAETELIQMSDHVVAPCKDCLPWVCLTNLKCSYKDEAYEFLSEVESIRRTAPAYRPDNHVSARYGKCYDRRGYGSG